MQLVDFKETIDNLNKKIKEDPNNIELLMKLVEVYLKVEGNQYYNSVITLDRILELDPNNFSANRIRGLIYKEQGNSEKSLDCFKVILDQYEYAKDHSEYQDILFDYAETLEEFDKEDESLAIFETLIEKSPNNVPILFKLAHLYTIKDKYNEAIEKYKKILELDPGNEGALTQLVELYETVDKILYHNTKAELSIKEGNFNRAISEYKKIIPIAEDDEEERDARKRIAMCYYLLEDYNRALDEYNQVLDTFDDDYEVYKGLGKIYVELEEPESAVENFQKAIKLNSNDSELYIDLADCFIEMEKYAEALSELEIVKKHIPDNMEVRCAIAEAYINVRDLYKAQEELNYVLARDKDNTAALGLLVDLNIEKENYEVALEISKKLIDLIPNSSYSARKIADCYKALGDSFKYNYNSGLAYELQSEYGMAIDRYEHALEIEPDNAELIMKIGDLYINLGEKYIGIEYYERAADVDESNIVALKKLSEFYLNNNDNDRAMEVLSRLVEVDKRNSDAYYNLALLNEKQKYLEEALESYKKFIDLAPNSNKSDKVHKKIASLEKKLYGKTDIIEGDSEEYYDADETVIKRLIRFFKGER